MSYWLKLIFYLVFSWGDDPRPVPPPVKPDPPKPVPVPDPPVVTPATMVLFDLPQTAIAMFQAGFPGREGVLLYALGQVANGWPIPGENEELILIDDYYPTISQWYDDRISEATVKLKQNPGLSLTILANDQKDRFGCRIGPPTMERLKEFGGRVQLGYFVPESEY